MSKTLTWLLLLALATAGLVYYTAGHTEQLKTPPNKKSVELNNIARVTADMPGNLYVIHDAKQHITKVRPDGTLHYQLAVPKRGNSYYSFQGVVGHSGGYVYVHMIELDSYGLYVKGEQIIRYTPTGKLDEVLVAWEYGEDERTMLRVGRIKSLQLYKDEVYFYSLEDNRIKLHGLTGPGQQEETIFEAELPGHHYVSEVAGVMPDEIYFTSKRGDIYRLFADGVSELYYAPGLIETKLAFPNYFRMGDEGMLYYLDLHAESVYAIRTLSSAPRASKALLSTGGEPFEPTEAVGLYPIKDGGLLLAMPDNIVEFNEAGELQRIITSAEFPFKRLIVFWSVWGAIALAALLVLLMLRLIYTRIMRRRISLIFKQILVFIPIIVVAMAILSNTIFMGFSNKMKSEVDRELQLLAHNGGELIDGNLLSQIRSPDDYGSDAYMAIKAKKDELFDVSSDAGFDREGLYSTLYKWQDGKIYLVMDDDDGVTMFRPFEDTEENATVIRDRTILSSEFEDANGMWMYAIGPVEDSNGDLIGIYEIGKEMNGFLTHQRLLFLSIVKNIILITGILIIVFLVMTFYLLSSIRKLRKSVYEMAGGYWDTLVDIRTRDEVADLGDSFNFMAAQIRNYIAEVTAIGEASSRFVPQQFIQNLGKHSILDVKLGDQVRQELTVMICNIRHFYALSKDLTPEQNFNFINSFLKRMGPILRSHNGMVDKYLGSGVRVLFADNSDDALKTAIAVRTELEVYNYHRSKVNYRAIDIGISLHRGPLMLGIIGEGERLDGGVISDDVNLTVILEGMSEELGATTLMTQKLLDHVLNPENIEYRSLGRVSVPGLDNPVQLYDVFQGDTELVRKLKRSTKEMFETAIAYYQVGRFIDARGLFLEVIRQNRQDKAAKHYFYLCDMYYPIGADNNWQGVLTIDTDSIIA